MKKTTLDFCLLCFLILLTGCNIKAPIKDILWEENKQLAHEIYLTSQKSDTLLLDSYYHTKDFDSITSTSLAIKQLNNKNAFVISPNSKSTEKLHSLHIWKDKKRITLLAFNTEDTIQTRFHYKSFLNNVLFISGEATHCKTIVMWQNTVLPTRFIKIEKKELAIFIPKEAKTKNESTLRIFIVNAHDKIEKLTIKLTAGQPS